MTKKGTLVGLGALILAGVSAFGLAAASTERADCPGKLVCPLTVELVCKDKCPLGESASTEELTVPACCQKK